MAKFMEYYYVTDPEVEGGKPVYHNIAVAWDTREKPDRKVFSFSKASGRGEDGKMRYKKAVKIVWSDGEEEDISNAVILGDIKRPDDRPPPRDFSDDGGDKIPF